MTFDQIIANLTTNNAKASGYLSVSELRALAAGVSVDVPGAKPNAVVLLYSGTLGTTGGALGSGDVAEKIGSESRGTVKTIGQTNVGKLLTSTEFVEALVKAAGSEAGANRQLFGDSSGATRIPNGLWDAASDRFGIPHRSRHLPHRSTSTGRSHSRAHRPGAGTGDACAFCGDHQQPSRYIYPGPYDSLERDSLRTRA